MPNRFSDAATYPFTAQDILCIDTNVWLDLFPPTPAFRKSKWVELCTSTYKKIKQSKASIIVDISVLSEYLNWYARFEWNVYKNNPGNIPFSSFKDFRNSAYFKPIAKTSFTLASRIIAQCRLNVQSIGGSFDIIHILDDYESMKCDFNDSVLAENCRIFGYKLVTNDDDFGKTDYGIDIITHNPKLLP